MKYINTNTKEVFALYHLYSVYPFLYGKELTDEILKEYNLVLLKYADKPEIKEYQQIIEGSIVNNVQTWLVEDLSLDILKNNKINEINAWKDSENQKPVTYQNELFDVDQESQFRVLTVVLLGNGSPTGYWTSADNKDIVADNAFMQGLYSAMLTKVATIHHRQRVMKAEIGLLTTPAEIFAYEVGAV